MAALSLTVHPFARQRLLRGMGAGVDGRDRRGVAEDNRGKPLGINGCAIHRVQQNTRRNNGCGEDRDVDLVLASVKTAHSADRPYCLAHEGVFQVQNSLQFFWVLPV